MHVRCEVGGKKKKLLKEGDFIGPGESFIRPGV